MTRHESPLPGCDVLRASGPDAAAYLQAQLASDVRALEPGNWQWSCYLTPQGRTQSAFVLFRPGPEEFLLAVPGGMAEPVRERLVRYRFRSKVELVVDPEWRVAGAFGAAPASAHGGRACAAAIPGARHLLVARAEAREPDAAAADRWLLADIATGVPVITAAVTDGHTPQALSLDRLAAFSVKKGCYPGQEIVARTHVLGRSKRTLARYACDADSPPPPGAGLVAGPAGDAAGTVISAACKGPRAIELLATVREGLAGLHLAGAPEAPLRPLDFEP